MKRSPNVLWILTDEQRFDALTGVTDGTWKFLNYLNAGNTLVDLRKSELENLTGNPAGQPLEQALYQWLLKTPPFRLPRTYAW